MNDDIENGIALSVTVTTDDLATWCPECGQTLDVIEPGWVRCPRCLWEQFKAGVSRAADRELERRLAVQERIEEEATRIPLGRKRGGGRKSGRRRRRERKAWWKPWYARSVEP